MKQIFLPLFLMIIFAGNCVAHDVGRNNFQMGVKAGANYANVYDEQGDDFNADGKFGFAGGVFMAIPLGQYAGVQPEVLFSQKGFKAKGSLLGSSYNLTRTTNYIDIPIYFAVKPLNSLTILAGPQFSYLLKQKDEFENSASSFEQSEVFKNENLRKNILSASLGVNFNLTRTVIGLRASWDLYRNHGDGTSTTPRYKNAWFQATAGYRLL
jgi:hypothetical protein